MRSRTMSLRARALIAAVTLALLVACAGSARAGVDPAGCAHPKGPFTTRGNQIMGYVLNHQQAPVRLYGITTFGLSDPGWKTSVTADESQMDAMAADWCANTVRIQAAPANLFNGSKANQAAFIAALKGEIAHAFADNLAVVLSAQTENSPGGLGLPTGLTANFWKTLGRALRGEPNVIFDIFNEPRVGPTDSDEMWTLWHDGGSVKGTRYIGMQTLVTDIRRDKIGRQLWVQGPETGDTLSRVGSADSISDPDHDLVYDIHHPAGPHTTAQWATDFGALAHTSPVVVGEWTQYSQNASECWNDGPTAAPAFLNYVSSLGLGLIGWTLQPGVLISGPSLDAPTTFAAGWTCARSVNQGIGSDLMSFFAAGNAKSTY